MRLDRYVSNALSTPRKASRQLIRAGRVQVNNEVVRDAMVHVVPSRDAVVVDGQATRAPGHLTLMMHKPTGCISATESDSHETVLDHVPDALRHRKLSPIGRLDKDTTGLLLLTTDGGLNHYLSHPKHKVDKIYLASLKEPLQPGAEAHFASGLTLADGTACRPARLEHIDDLQVRVVLSEGRFHQVKRMLGAVGGHVTALHRHQIGKLQLDPTLEAGAVRELTEADWQALHQTLPKTRSPATWDPPPGHQPRRRRRHVRRGEGVNTPTPTEVEP